MRKHIPVADNDILKDIKNVSHEDERPELEAKLSVRKKMITPATIKSIAIIL